MVSAILSCTSQTCSHLLSEKHSSKFKHDLQNKPKINTLQRWQPRVCQIIPYSAVWDFITLKLHAKSPCLREVIGMHRLKAQQGAMAQLLIVQKARYGIAAYQISIAGLVQFPFWCFVLGAGLFILHVEISRLQRMILSYLPVSRLEVQQLTSNGKWCSTIVPWRKKPEC